jgi:hypothetical protein
MQGGDLSNEVPPRLLVTLDAISDEYVEAKTFLGIRVGTRTERIIDRESMATLWRVSLRAFLRMELVVFTDDVDEATRILDDLDRQGVQPFNYSSACSSPDTLVELLPYRPEVIGVLDTPERRARYGIAGIDIGYLTGML